MDMNVNTDAFLNASSSLKKRCGKIESMTAFFLKLIHNARAGFDDVNYDRTVAAASGIKREIAAFSDRVALLNRDLKMLEDYVNEYANGGYGR